MIRLTTSDQIPEIRRFESEKSFKDPNKNNATYVFPFLEEEGSIDLSVVIPAFNEEERSKITYHMTLNFMTNKLITSLISDCVSVI